MTILKRMTAFLLALLSVSALCVGASAMTFAGDDSAPAMTGGSTVIFYLNGDADGDGKITILDATLIQRVLVVLSKDTDGTIAIRGDVDKDGLTILDATAIQRYLAGYTVTQKIGVTMNYVIGGNVELPEDEV